MVERPIKKSERLAQTPSDDNPDSPIAQPTGQSNVTRPERGSERGPERGRRDKDKGKGRRGSRDSEPKVAINPALMRGPKPVKPQPPVVEEPLPETEPDSSSEETLETTSSEQPED